MLAKWNSLPNHIVNIHEGHSEEYPRCSHAETEADADVEWFDPGIFTADYFFFISLNNTLAVHAISKAFTDSAEMKAI